MKVEKITTITVDPVIAAHNPNLNPCTLDNVKETVNYYLGAILWKILYDHFHDEGRHIVYTSGGTTRDIIRKIFYGNSPDPRDIDLVVTKFYSQQEIMNIFQPHCITVELTGYEHNLYKLTFPGGLVCDLKVGVVNLNDDVKQRDLILNCGYINVFSGTLYGLKETYNHIVNGIIATVESPEISYAEDSGRIMRTVDLFARQLAWGYEFVASIDLLESLRACGKYLATPAKPIDALKNYHKLINSLGYGYGNETLYFLEKFQLTRYILPNLADQSVSLLRVLQTIDKFVRQQRSIDKLRFYHIFALIYFVRFFYKEKQYKEMNVKKNIEEIADEIFAEENPAYKLLKSDDQLKYVKNIWDQNRLQLETDEKIINLINEVFKVVKPDIAPVPTESPKKLKKSASFSSYEVKEKPVVESSQRQNTVAVNKLEPLPGPSKPGKEEIDEVVVRQVVEQEVIVKPVFVAKFAEPEVVEHETITEGVVENKKMEPEIVEQKAPSVSENINVPSASAKAEIKQSKKPNKSPKPEKEKTEIVPKSTTKTKNLQLNKKSKAEVNDEFAGLDLPNESKPNISVLQSVLQSITNFFMSSSTKKQTPATRSKVQQRASEYVRRQIELANQPAKPVKPKQTMEEIPTESDDKITFSLILRYFFTAAAKDDLKDPLYPGILSFARFVYVILYLLLYTLCSRILPIDPILCVLGVFCVTAAFICYDNSERNKLLRKYEKQQAAFQQQEEAKQSKFERRMQRRHQANLSQEMQANNSENNETPNVIANPNPEHPLYTSMDFLRYCAPKVAERGMNLSPPSEFFDRWRIPYLATGYGLYKFFEFYPFIDNSILQAFFAGATMLMIKSLDHSLYDRMEKDSSSVTNVARFFSFKESEAGKDMPPWKLDNVRFPYVVSTAAVYGLFKLYPIIDDPILQIVALFALYMTIRSADHHLHAVKVSELERSQAPAHR